MSTPCRSTATCRRGATATTCTVSGSCDMKGGVAVALQLAAGLAEPNRDVTYVFYECEEVEADRNGLSLISQVRPELLAGDFAVLMEPSNAVVEAGCQGTMRVDVTTTGKRAHSARSWNGVNAIHAARPRSSTGWRRTSRDEPVIDGLNYHEGLNAVAIRGASPATSSRTRARSASTTGSRPTAAWPRPKRTCARCSTGFELVVSRLRAGRAAGPRPAGGRGVRRRRSAVRPTRSSAGPTCRGSARSGSRRSTSGRATRARAHPGRVRPAGAAAPPASTR